MRRIEASWLRGGEMRRIEAFFLLREVRASAQRDSPSP